jgi:hypothetical protein
MNFRLWTFLVLLSASLTAAAASASAQQVGVNSAVNTNAAGTPPGAATQRLVVGQKVVYHEHIVTDAGGQAQILFLDESAMTIGPNSDLMIDEFVYDPSTGTGKLAMSATKGVMRFVGGRISKLENAVTMQTPSASIGIRGGVFIMDQQAAGPLEVDFVFGKGLTVTGASGVSQDIIRPGFSVSVAGPGATPTPPAPAPAGRLAGLLAQLDGKSGGNGGATTVPTEASVANSGISSTISGDFTASVQAASATQPAASQPQPVNVTNLQGNLQLSTVSTQTSVAQAAATTAQFTNGAVLVFGNNGVVTAGGFTATLANGQLTIPAQPPAFANAVSVPLSPGTATFSNGQFSGQSFLSSDSSAFAAAVNSGGGFGAPNGQTAVLFGGNPTINLPTTGVGTYNGSAFGAVTNGGLSYTASGGFNASYNFGSQTGNVNFSNFDGKNFGGPVAGSSGVYAGSLAGSGVSGAAAGTFFGTGASSTAGLFTVANPSATYTATGVFAGGH